MSRTQIQLSWCSGVRCDGDGRLQRCLRHCSSRRRPDCMAPAPMESGLLGAATFSTAGVLPNFHSCQTISVGEESLQPVTVQVFARLPLAMSRRRVVTLQFSEHGIQRLRFSQWRHANAERLNRARGTGLAAAVAFLAFLEGWCSRSVLLVTQPHDSVRRGSLPRRYSQ